MNRTQGSSTSVAFLARVAAALEDLPPAERGELLADVRSNLADVLAAGEAPQALLGTPEAFAAELREAAGLPRSASSSRLHRRVGRAGGVLWWWPVSGFLVGYGFAVGGPLSSGVSALIPRINGYALLGALAVMLSTAVATTIGAACARWKVLLPAALAGSLTLVAVACVHLAQAVRLLG